MMNTGLESYAVGCARRARVVVVVAHRLAAWATSGGLFTAALGAVWLLAGSSGIAQDTVAAQVEAAVERAASETYELRYRFTAGESIGWTVRHLSTTETTMQGQTQTTRSRTISTKVWDVQEVDAAGNMTFVHRVADIDMWQKISERPEVRYNRRTDGTPPPEFAQVAKSIDTPLATVTIAPTGKVLRRTGTGPQVTLGLGEICVPLPAGPVRVGQQWQTSQDVHVRRPDGMRQRVKTRVVYSLAAVKSGVATIAVKTEVLTPVHDPRVQAQLVQQLTDGTIRFDLDAGRVLSREVDWDETVVGFNGPDSLMKYLARFTEELQSTPVTAQTPGPAQR